MPFASRPRTKRCGRAFRPEQPHGSFTFSAFLYRYRNLVERFFNKLKQFRGIATRYDKNPDNFLAAIKLASARIWIRSYESASSVSDFTSELGKPCGESYFEAGFVAWARQKSDLDRS